MAPSLSRPTHMRGSSRICVECYHTTHKPLLIHLASTKSHSRYNMSVTRSPHPCPLSITSSLMLQHETHVTPTPQCYHNVTSCSLSSSLYTTPPTHHPRICVHPYAYAWLHPDHFTNIPTHMRYFQRI
ncbi:hypothetical protein PIB30_107728, partial [Stylosanthes scabra]|nr:hypothetical protein [Stylosanthes scabra]